MILLSEDGKSLVDIKSWDDITGRPGYTQTINPSEVKLKQIIARYNISPKQACGISSCGTAHNMGFLVVCEGGIETNIGHRCGKKIFGVEFQALEKSFTRDTNAQRYRENIATYKNQIADDEKRILFLWEGESQGEWCFNKVHQYATTAFEERTSNALLERAKRKDSQIKKSVSLSATEKQATGGSGRFAHFRDEIVGVISGLSALTDYKKLKTILTVRLGEELQEFKALDEDTLSYRDLRRWNNWVNMVGKKMREAQEIIQECQRFVVPSNIKFIRDNKRLLVREG